MTEAYRKGALEAGIQIDGMDDLRTASKGFDSLMEKMEAFDKFNDHLKKSFGFMRKETDDTKQLGHETQNTTNHYRAMHNEISRLVTGMHNLKGMIGVNATQSQDLANKVDGIRNSANSIHTLSDDFSKNRDVIQSNTKATDILKERLKHLNVGNNGSNNGIGGTTSKLKKHGRITDKIAHKTHHLRQVMAGTFLGNMFANGIGNISGRLKTATEQGLQFTSTVDDIQKDWHNVGLNKQQTKSMMDQLQQIRLHANISGAAIAQMQHRYLGLTNGNIGQAQKLMSSVTAFEKDSNMGDRQSKLFNRMISSNQKVNAQMFNKAIPDSPLRKELIKMSGMSKNAFQSMLNNGKLTGNQLRNYMISASRDSGKAWQQYLNTNKGKLDALHSTITNTRNDFNKGLANNIFKGIQKIVGSRKSIVQVQKTLMGIGTTLGQKVGSVIGKTIGFISKNRKPLAQSGKAIWSIVKSLASGAWSVIKSVITTLGGNSKKAGSGLQSVANSLTAIAKHKTAIKNFGKAFLTIFAFVKARKFLKLLWSFGSPLMSMAKKTTSIITVMGRLHGVTKTFKFFHHDSYLRIAKVGKMFKNLVPVSKNAFRSVSGVSSRAFRGIGKVGTRFLKPIGSTMVKGLKGIGRIGATAFKGIGRFAMMGSRKVFGMLKAINLTKIATVAWSGISKAFTAVQWAFNVALDANPIGAIVLGITAVIGGLYELYKHFKPFRQLVNGTFKGAIKYAKKFGHWLGKTFHGVAKNVGHFLHGFGKFGHGVAKGIGHGISAIGKFRNSVHRKLLSSVKTAGSKIGHFAHGVGHTISTHFNSAKKSAMGFARSIAGRVQNTYSKGMNQLKKHSNGTYKVIKSGTRVLSDVMHGKFSNLKKDIPDLVQNMWGSVKSNFSKSFNFVKNITHDALKKVHDTFSSWGDKLKNIVGDIWKDIKQSTANSINNVSGLINDGIKGFNGLLKKVGGSGHTIGLIPKVHFKNGTSNGKLTRNTLSMLNDGNDSPTTHNREMAILPNGRTFIPKKRNWVGFLPKGTEILNATQTKMLMELRGIRHFGLGTLWNKASSGVGHFTHHIASGVGHMTSGARKFISKGWNGAKHFTGSMANKVKNAGVSALHGVKKVASAIAHPIRFIKSLFSKHFNLPPFFTDLGNGLMNKVKNLAIHFFNMNSGGANNPAGASVKRWIPVIKKVGQFMHQSISGSDIGALLNRIQKESGGNPTITQGVQDINSEHGDPARGLVQYIPPTFKAWAVRGHEKLLNGFDQLAAVLNDSNWKSDIRMPGGWGPTGHRERKKGGNVLANHWYQFNEAGQELFKPNKNGKIIDHKTSQHIIDNAKRPISIDNRTNITIKGNADKSTVKNMSDVLDNKGNSLADRLEACFGDSGVYEL
ncbi:hypothetical protein DY120_07450 [Apilactobacillus micheneri]|uniref:Tape measure domain-containing protein n=1 Tax=Apilactobacillus micheneri TaxID=1899430 RepID=A0ABY2YV14_9LACO|nr:hypothetical protein [Apilactobacillus micheneri]TPR23133.1 hypothetical protein DY114_07435 [Apilactobacillus micheneri]TPR24451.1 hypothetical protein DY111_07450 [Apilactobacillus micheneri]TPR29398.1 hypothetical protein DY120_07450 [Apilactobacillus micheneri]TPR34605.1 hypothetical protein DY027_07440 [Apilactobacillus micheneri]